MIRCCFCMSWFHQQCVGIGKDDPIGIWLCINCRSVPANVQNEISSLKLNVDQLKTTTELILSSVTNLTTKLENSIGGINDRLTALTRQINLHDITTSEAIENVSSKMASIKTSLDQKTNLIQSKTTAVFDKIKTFENSVKRDIHVPGSETKTTAERGQNSKKSNTKRDKGRQETSKNNKKTKS